VVYFLLIFLDLFSPFIHLSSALRAGAPTPQRLAQVFGFSHKWKRLFAIRTDHPLWIDSPQAFLSKQHVAKDKHKYDNQN